MGQSIQTLIRAAANQTLKVIEALEAESKKHKSEADSNKQLLVFLRLNANNERMSDSVYREVVLNSTKEFEE